MGNGGKNNICKRSEVSCRKAKQLRIKRTNLAAEEEESKGYGLQTGVVCSMILMSIYVCFLGKVCVLLIFYFPKMRLVQKKRMRGWDG